MNSICRSNQLARLLKLAHLRAVVSVPAQTSCTYCEKSELNGGKSRHTRRPKDTDLAVSHSYANRKSKSIVNSFRKSLMLAHEQRHWIRTSSQSIQRNLSTKQGDIIMNVFDRKAKRVQRDRAALGYNGEDPSVYDYIKDEFGFRLSDRICDIKRKFGLVIDLGCGRGHVTKHLYSDMVENIYQCDLSPALLDQAAVSPEVPTHKMVIDEEHLPFEPASADLVVSNLSLHWVNDLPGCLVQVRNILKNDSPFIGSLFGGDTLFELRVSLQLAEIEREGGFAPHISPFVTVNDLGNLLNRAGFTMLTIDIDDVQIIYPSMFELMHDLKGMAENNCSWNRKPQLHRDSMIAAASIYKEMYGTKDGIPATFQVINFIGWKPDPSQPKAAERGSGEVSLKDLDKFEELTKQIKELREDTTDDVKKAASKLENDLREVTKAYKDPDDSGDDRSKK